MDTSWFRKIPLADFDEDKTILMTQLGATKWSSTIQFYRAVREPLDVDDLLCDAKGNHLIWLNKGCFIMRKKLPKSVPHGSTIRQAATNIDFGSESIFIYGKTDDIVARAISLLLCLNDENSRTVRIGTRYSRASDPAVPTTFLTSLFLSEYTEANPDRRLILGRGCHPSEEQSIVLASHPERLDIGLECVFKDWGRTFINTLLKRKSDFGTLSLHNGSASYQTYRVFLDVMEAVHNITLHTTSLFLNHSVHLPLSSVAKRVEYEVWDFVTFDEIFDRLVDPVTVVPKAFTVVFAHSIPARFHTLFLQGSGNVQELGMIYENGRPPSIVQRIELFQAITTNKNIYRLELGCLAVLEDFWDELLELIGSHESLRYVVFWVSDVPHLGMIVKLAAFMKNRFHLDVSFKYRDVCHCQVKAIDNIIEPVLFRNRAKSLTRVSSHDRAALFGAALTNWASGDASKINLLLIESTDLLCSLVGQPQQRGKRQRDLLSFPQFTMQKKPSDRKT